MNALSSPNATGPVTRQSLRQRSLYQRSTFLVLLLALVSFVLAACSVDISTTQKIDSKGKGTRTMTAVVEVEDDDATKVDAKKVEKSLRKAAPKGTEVTSVKKNGDKLTIKVEMSFKDIDEYKEVLSNALKAGGHNADSLEVEFRAIEGPLREDVLLKENASSRQLLDWMGQALIKDRLLTKKELEEFRVEDRGGTLDIGKSSFKDPRTPFFESKRIDHGFTSIRPLIEIKPDGYRVAVSYDMNNVGREQENARSKWIESVMPEGAEKVRTEDKRGIPSRATVIVKDVKDEKELESFLAPLLGDKNVKFTVTESEHPENPLVRIREYILSVDCSETCSNGEQRALIPLISDPDATYRRSGIKESEENELGFTQGAGFLVLAEVSGEKKFRAVAEKSEKLSSFTALLKPGAGDAVSFEVEVGVALAQLNADVEDIEKKLAPSDGSITSEMRGDEQVFTLKWEGSDTQELVSEVRKSFGSFSITEESEGALWQTTKGTVKLNPYADLHTDFEATPRLKVEPPALSSLSGDVPDEGYDLRGSTAEYSYSGPTIVGLVVAGAVIVLVILLVLLVVVLRKKKGAKAKGTGQRSVQDPPAYVQDQNHSHAMHWQTGNYSAPPAPPAGDAPPGPPMPPAENRRDFAPPPPEPQPGDDAAPPAPPAPPEK